LLGGACYIECKKNVHRCGLSDWIPGVKRVRTSCFIPVLIVPSSSPSQLDINAFMTMACVKEVKPDALQEVMGSKEEVGRRNLRAFPLLAKHCLLFAAHFTIVPC